MLTLLVDSFWDCFASMMSEGRLIQMIYVSGMERAKQQQTKNLKGWSEGHFTILGMMILCVCVCVLWKE